MKTIIFFSLASLVVFSANAQQNVTYQPEHPKPGDVITVQYTPAGALEGTTKNIEGLYYLHQSNGIVADDLNLTNCRTCYGNNSVHIPSERSKAGEAGQLF